MSILLVKVYTFPGLVKVSEFYCILFCIYCHNQAFLKKKKCLSRKIFCQAKLFFVEVFNILSLAAHFARLGDFTSAA